MSNSKKSGGAPARTSEAREQQLINLAYNEAEKRIKAGKASAQVLTHFLRLGTVKAELEKEKLKQENLLLQAKTEQIKSAKIAEELFAEALKAMRKYQGEPEFIEDDLDD